MNKRITGLLTALTIAATPIALPARAADTDPAYRVYMARYSFNLPSVHDADNT